MLYEANHANKRLKPYLLKLITMGYTIKDVKNNIFNVIEDGEEKEIYFHTELNKQLHNFLQKQFENKKNIYFLCRNSDELYGELKIGVLMWLSTVKDSPSSLKIKMGYLDEESGICWHVPEFLN